MAITFVKMGLQPSSQVRFGPHRYWQSHPIRILNAIGRKTTPASIPCLHLKVPNCENSGRLNSYVGAGMFLMVPATKFTLLHAYTPWRPPIRQYYLDESMIDDANVFSKVLLSVGKSLID